MFVSDKTKKAEGLGKLFKIWERISAKAGKNLVTNAVKTPGRFSEIGANVTTAGASWNFTAALSTLAEVMFFLSFK